MPVCKNYGKLITRRARFSGAIVQLGERYIRIVEVAGSNPARSTICQRMLFYKDVLICRNFS